MNWSDDLNFERKEKPCGSCFALKHFSSLQVSINGSVNVESGAICDICGKEYVWNKKSLNYNISLGEFLNRLKEKEEVKNDRNYIFKE